MTGVPRTLSMVIADIDCPYIANRHGDGRFFTTGHWIWPNPLGNSVVESKGGFRHLAMLVTPKTTRRRVKIAGLRSISAVRDGTAKGQ